MQIISFDYEPSSKRGGQELALLEVLSGLKKLGHSIQLGYVVEGNLLDQYKDKEIDTIHIKRINLRNKLNFKEYKEVLQAMRSFSSPKGKIIYLNQLNDAPLALMLKLLYGCRIICHLRLPPLGYSAQIKLSIPFIDTFIVANKHMLEMHSNGRIPKDRTTIIPDGLWINEISIPIKKPNLIFKIAFVGRIDHIKGIHVLIDAALLLKENGIIFQLDIAGQPMSLEQESYLQSLKEKVEIYELHNNVFFVGHVSQPIKYLADYDVCVFPSVWDEPFGRVIIESLLAETPVIGNDVGSVAEIMNDVEKKWVYKTTEELAAKIMELKEYPQSYDVEAKRDFVRENFDLDDIILNIQSVLEKHCAN